MYYLLLIPLLLVGYKTSMKFKIIVKTMLLVCRIMFMRCLQYFDPRVWKLSKNKFEINYVLGNKLYKFQTKIKRGPATVLQIIDKDYNDVTKLVKPWLGPNRDFHNIKYTPATLGFEELVFQMSTGEEKTFSKSEIIELV